MFDMGGMLNEAPDGPSGDGMRRRRQPWVMVTQNTGLAL